MRYSDVKNVLPYLAGLVCVVIVLILLLPFLSGRVLMNPLGTMPTFHVRIRVLTNRPSRQKFTFRLGSQSQVLQTPALQWSEWQIYGAAEAQATLKSQVGIARENLPAIVKLNIGGVVGLTAVDAELKFDDTGETTNLHGELFGPSLGILVWRDKSGKPLADTMAGYNRAYWTALDGIDLRASDRPKQFLILDRFIGGDDDLRNWREGLTNLSRAGSNTLMLPPSPYLRDLLLKAGLRRTWWGVYSPPGGVLGLTPDLSDEAIQSWARQQAAPYLKAGYSPRDMAVFQLSDEPGWYYPSSLRLLSANPASLGGFRDYLRDQHLSPGDLDTANWSEVKPMGQSVLRSAATSSLGSKRLFYWTMRFFAWDSARHYAHTVRALENAFYPRLPVYTNWNFFSGRFYVPGPFGKNPEPGSEDAGMRSQDWFEFARLRGGTVLWTEDWFPDQLNYMWSYYCSKLRSAAEAGGVDFGGHVIGRTTGQRNGGLIQRVLSIVGGGGKAIDYYWFGPAYTFPGNAYSEHPEILREIAQANRMIAAGEDVLWPGHPPRPQVAILAPRSAEVWDVLEMPDAARSPKIIDATNARLNDRTVDYMAEVFDLYLALQHTNVPANFVDEDDLSRAGLKPYRVLYITEPDIPVEGQRSIAQWVREGGTLVMVSGAGAKDRYDVRSAILDGLAGISAQPRPRLSLLSFLNAKPVGLIRSIDGEFTAYLARGAITPTGARVLLRFNDGAPAVVQNDVQKGYVIYFAWFPGLSYVHSRSALPAGFPTGIRRLIVAPLSLAKVSPVVSVSVPMVETPVLLSRNGAALILLNWRNEPIQQLTITTHLPFAVRNVRSIVRGPIQCEHHSNAISCVLPLDTADILILRP
jgi:hypothetical protein